MNSETPHSVQFKWGLTGATGLAQTALQGRPQPQTRALALCRALLGSGSRSPVVWQAGKTGWWTESLGDFEVAQRWP